MQVHLGHVLAQRVLSQSTALYLLVHLAPAITTSVLQTLAIAVVSLPDDKTQL